MRPLRTRDQVLLVQLADGSLTGAAREKAEARLRTIPDGDRLIERQRRVARALAAGAELPPPQPAPTPAWHRAPQLAVAGALLAVLALLLLVSPPGGGSTVERAAAISQLPATQPPPEASGALLRAEVDGVAFPEWEREFGWHETGMRHDEIDGRRTTTVFYEHMGHRLAYTIVSGPALRPPTEARSYGATASRSPSIAILATAATTSPCSSAADGHAWSPGTFSRCRRCSSSPRGVAAAASAPERPPQPSRRSAMWNPRVHCPEGATHTRRGGTNFGASRRADGGRRRWTPPPRRSERSVPSGLDGGVS